jgi:hypothetical protein
MPHNHEWQSRIKAVEREYMAMRQAADRFRQAAHGRSNPRRARRSTSAGDSYRGGRHDQPVQSQRARALRSDRPKHPGSNLTAYASM